MYGSNFKNAVTSLMSHCKEQMGYDKDPDVHFVTDKDNSNNMLGYTAHYQPDKRIVTVYISNRHPKDVLRSLSHELVHHAQNCRGDLTNSQTEEGYAQKDPHMRKMEEEAYLKGNMMFRDWEDSCKAQDKIKLTLPITIGENKMDSQLQLMIMERTMVKVREKLIEEGVDINEIDMDAIEERFFKGIRAKAAGALAGLGQRGSNLALRGKGAVAGAKLDPDAVADLKSRMKDPKMAAQEAKFKSLVTNFEKEVRGVRAELIKLFEKLQLISGQTKGTKAVASRGRAANPSIERAIGDLGRAAGQLKKALGEGSMVPLEKPAAGDKPGAPAAPGGVDMDRAASAERNRVAEAAMPDFPDVDGDDDREEPISKAQKDKKKKEGEKGKKKDKDMSKVPPQLRKHVAKKVEEGGPFQIGKSSIKQHSKDLAKNYGDSETASLILRGASREDLMAALQDLLSSGDITPGQLQAAASKMQDVSSKYGSMEEADLDEKSLGSSPGAGIDKFVEKGVFPVIKVVTKGAARTAGAGVGATVGALKGAGKGAKDGYDFVKNKLGLEEEFEELEEGGAAQRQGNEDRLRRQEPDRIKEETLEEGKCPHCDGDAPKSKCTCSVKEGSMKKTDRFKEGDKVKHKTDDLGVGTVVSRSGNTVGVRWPSGMRSADHNMLRKVTKESKESELANIKRNQDSISSLNEARLLNVNKELMRRLIK